MSEAPPEQLPPSPLEYASAGGPTPVLDVRYRPAATFLITVTLLAAVADGALGLLYVDRLGLAGGLLIGTAAVVVFVIFRYVSTARPSFGRAAVATGMATAVAFVAHVLVETGYDEQRREILKNAVGPVVVVHVESDRGARLATWELCRYGSAAAAFLLLVLTCYLVVRYLNVVRASKARA